MVISVKVRDSEGEEIREPYLLYLGGWTEERYFIEAPESQYVEYADGELIVHSPVSIRHQEITGFLFFLLMGYVDHRNLGMVLQGPAVVRLRPELNYEPDVFFVPADRLDRLEEQRFSGAPSLVVEVLSESTRNYDLRVKAANYLQSGVQEYWVVDLANRRLLRHLIPPGSAGPYDVTEFGSGRLESHAVPGFWMEVSWLWAEPRPGTLECLRAILDL